MLLRRTAMNSMWTCLVALVAGAAGGISASLAAAAIVPEEIQEAAAAAGEQPQGVSVSEVLDKQDALTLSKDLQPDRRFIILHEELRPSWVEAEPVLKGEGEHTISVSSDPWKTEFECRQSLDKKLKQAFDDYVDNEIGRNDAARRLKLDVDYIKRHVVREEYAEELHFSEGSIGDMKQRHAQLVFSPEFRTKLGEAWKEEVVTARLMQTALGIAAVLGLITTAFGYLKADAATRGHHSTRLKLAALGAILALLASSATVARWIPWL